VNNPDIHSSPVESIHPTAAGSNVNFPMVGHASSETDNRTEIDGAIIQTWERVKNRYFYNSKGKDFLIKQRSGTIEQFVPYNESTAREFLYDLARGPDEKGRKMVVSAVMKMIKSRNFCCWCGSLAGYDAGVYQSHGKQYLVTTSPTRLESEPGDWSTIRGILDAMFSIETDPHQMQSFLYSLAISRRKFFANQRDPGRCMVFAGPVQSGKTLLMDCIIVPLLGGRLSKCFKYMSGSTSFNSDLFSSEVLFIDDEAFSARKNDTQQLEAQIKQVTATRWHRLEGKGVDALEFNPFWRLFICINDTPNGLAVLPYMVEGLRDKVNLYQIQRAPQVPSSDTEKQLFLDRIEAELPYFAHYLENLEIPYDPNDSRNGVGVYHNPAIIGLLLGSEDTEQIMAIVTQAVTQRPSYNSLAPRVEESHFVGDAGQVLQWVRERLPDELRRALDANIARRGSNGFAQLMGYCAAKYPNGVIKKTGRGQWRVGPNESTRR
jgi:hypothetical protein